MPGKKFSWEEMPAEQVSSSLRRRMVVGENEMLCWLELKPGCKVPEHRHIHEQISHVLKGRLRFKLGNQTVEVGPGEILLIPPNQPHSAEVIGDETVIDYDIFSPIRRDWVDGTDTYLRQ